MRKIFFFLLMGLLYSSTSAFAQENTQSEQKTITEDTIVNAVPRIGTTVFIQNLTFALNRPKFDKAIISDTLTFKFVIDEKGQMFNLRLIKSDIKNSFYEQDILSVFYSLSKWKTATKNGNPIMSLNTMQFVPRKAVKTKKRN